tara:strand:- start:960 stop:3041 length:2082 start_codon:yes stop_codon:yes gene_type:complete
MPKVLPSIFSYESMKAKWDEDNPDEPYNRQSDLIAGRYALDQWIVRVDDEGKVIAATGWKEHPTHTAVGGTKAVEGAPSGQYKAIVSERERQVNQSKPLLAAFGHSSGDNDRWFGYMRQNGWAFVNDPNWEKYKTLIPEELLTDWLSRFPSNMGIRPVQGTEDMSKAVYSDEEVDWFNLNKNERYTISIGKKGYDVVDNKTSQPVNRTGLSRSRAKAMLVAIENGETDLTQYETKVKRKATSTQDWRTILRKYLPDNSFEEYSIGEPVADLGTRDRFKDKNIKSLGNIQHKAFVTEQYLRQVSDRLPDASNSSMNTWLGKLNSLNLSKGKYWFFGTNVREDRTYVTIDVINKGDRYLDTAKKFNLQDMDSAIVFIGVSKSMVGKIKRGQTIPVGRKFIDLWGIGGVRGLQKKDSRPFQRRTSIRKWTNVLKWQPSENYAVLEGYKTLVDGKPSKKPSRNKSTVLVTGHYMDRGVKRATDSEMELDDWADKIVSENVTGKGRWFYRKKDKNHSKGNDVVMFDLVQEKETFPQQDKTKPQITNSSGAAAYVFTTYMNSGTNKIPSKENWYDMWDEGELRPESRVARHKDDTLIDISSLESQLGRAERDFKMSTDTAEKKKKTIQSLNKELRNAPNKRKREVEEKIEEAIKTRDNANKNKVTHKQKIKMLKEKIEEAKIEEARRKKEGEDNVENSS